MKKILVVAIAALALPAIGTLNGCRHGRHPGAELMIDYLAEALDLSEAQRGQADRIKAELLAKARGLKSGHLKAAVELKTLLASEEIDPERVRQLVAEHRGRMDELVDLAIARIVEFHRTLSPEQRAKLVAKMEKFRGMPGARCAFGNEE
jgi:Spy/CpxP family protein refolding chaperone